MQYIKEHRIYRNMKYRKKNKNQKQSNNAEINKRTDFLVLFLKHLLKDIY